MEAKSIFGVAKPITDVVPTQGSEIPQGRDTVEAGDDYMTIVKTLIKSDPIVKQKAIELAEAAYQSPIRTPKSLKFLKLWLQYQDD